MCVGWSTTPQYISRTSHGAPRLPSAARRGPSAGAAKCEGRLWTCPRTRPTRTVPGRAAPPTSRPLPSLFPLSYLFSTAAGRPGLETPSTSFRLEPEATGTVDTRGQLLPSCRGGAGSVGRGQPAEDLSAREGESQRILPPPRPWRRAAADATRPAPRLLLQRARPERGVRTASAAAAPAARLRAPAGGIAGAETALPPLPLGSGLLSARGSPSGRATAAARTRASASQTAAAPRAVGVGSRTHVSELDCGRILGPRFPREVAAVRRGGIRLCYAAPPLSAPAPPPPPPPFPPGPAAAAAASAAAAAAAAAWI